MAYKMKIMTEEQLKEVDELWNNGHAEALTAYGWECVNAWREGCRVGVMKTCAKGAVGALAIVGVMGVAGMFLQAVDNRTKKQKQIDEQQDYEE